MSTDHRAIPEEPRFRYIPPTNIGVAPKRVNPSGSSTVYGTAGNTMGYSGLGPASLGGEAQTFNVPNLDTQSRTNINIRTYPPQLLVIKLPHVNLTIPIFRAAIPIILEAVHTNYRPFSPNVAI